MSIEWVNQAIDDLRAWGRTREVEVDADEVRLLCDYASDYLNVNELGDFSPETFDELLLSIYPRKVIAPPESAPETVAAARTLVDYLSESGQVSAETAGLMRERLDDIEPRMSGALADPANFGMAKSLFSSIGPESLEQSIAIPSGELPDLGEAPCDCPACTPLPAVRLADPGDLRAALEAVPMLAEQPLPDGDEPLTAWAQRVAHLLEQDTGGAVTGSAELDEGLYDLCDMLYRLQVRVPVTVIRDHLDEIAGDGEVDLPPVLGRLEWSGLLQVTGDSAELTPQGVWALREHYLSSASTPPRPPTWPRPTRSGSSRVCSKACPPSWPKTTSPGGCPAACPARPPPSCWPPPLARQPWPAASPSPSSTGSGPTPSPPSAATSRTRSCARTPSTGWPPEGCPRRTSRRTSCCGSASTCWPWPCPRPRRTPRSSPRTWPPPAHPPT
ncbi:hypothetical protein ACFQYP_30265 [Nonomuraea antimicrobica]